MLYNIHVQCSVLVLCVSCERWTIIIRSIIHFVVVISIILSTVKVGRMSYEYSTDLQKVGLPIQQAFEEFARKHKRPLKLEIEPGTYLVANAGALLCTVQDIVSTKSTNSSGHSTGHEFIKLDAGMTEVLRPSL